MSVGSKADMGARERNLACWWFVKSNPRWGHQGSNCSWKRSGLDVFLEMKSGRQRESCPKRWRSIRHQEENNHTKKPNEEKER